VLQVNGKLRSKVELPVNVSKDEVEKLALQNEAVLRFTEGLTIRKVIFVPGKLLNIVAS